MGYCPNINIVIYKLTKLIKNIPKYIINTVYEKLSILVNLLLNVKHPSM